MLCLGLVVWFACSPGGEAHRPPNILLITLDTTRSDHCSVYGYLRDTTPNLRSFAQQGARFDMAYAPTGSTGPTHASIFTSLYPIAHHVIKNGLVLPGPRETLAEILREQGYSTAAVVSSFVMNSKFGYDQGFSFYDDRFEAEESTHHKSRWQEFELEGNFDRRADHTTNRAIGWLDAGRNKEQPFFLFVHYFDPHDPYVPPEPHASRFMTQGTRPQTLREHIALYDGEIAFTDQEVGRLLEALDTMGLGEQTLVVITADHGEGLMEHGHMFHGVNIYEEMVRVPLLMRWPGHIEAGLQVSAPVELVDLVPTLLDLGGIETKGRPFQGRSVAPVLRGEASLDPERPVFLYRRHYEDGYVIRTWVRGEKYGIKAGNWKYIEGEEEKTWELFDLAVDPGEKQNRFSDLPEKARELAEQLEAWRAANWRKGSAQKPISEEDLERLEALGYVE
jgi:arylsulfatase A-like enzyme